MKKVTKSREFDSIKENQPIESGYKKPNKHTLIKSFTQQADQNLKKTEDNIVEKGIGIGIGAPTGKLIIETEGSVGMSNQPPNQILNIEKSKKDEYVDKPAENTVAAKGKFVKVKKSFGNIKSIEKGGPKKFPSERDEITMPKCDQNIAKDEKKDDEKLDKSYKKIESKRAKETPGESYKYEGKKPKLGTGERFKELVNVLKKKSLDENIGDSPIIKSLDEIDHLNIVENDIDELENIIKSANNPEALAAWIGRKKYGKKRYQEMVKEGKKEKSLNSSNGSGGDLITPQIAGSKKGKYVKVKKSLDNKSFFVQSGCQSE